VCIEYVLLNPKEGHPVSYQEKVEENKGMGGGGVASGLVGIEKCIFVPSGGALGFPLRSSRADTVRVLFKSFAFFGLFGVLFLGSFIYFLCT
jgi:hypothetical protein